MTDLKWMLDTNTVSALMRDATGRLWELLESKGPEFCCMSIIVACELRFGAARRQSPRIEAEIADMAATVAILPFAAPADQVYGEIRARLAAEGTPIGPNDTFIAAHALALDLTLVTANIREFSRVPGLKVENWLD